MDENTFLEKLRLLTPEDKHRVDLKILECWDIYFQQIKDVEKIFHEMTREERIEYLEKIFHEMTEEEYTEYLAYGREILARHKNIPGEKP